MSKTSFNVIESFSLLVTLKVKVTVKLVSVLGTKFLTKEIVFKLHIVV